MPPSQPAPSQPEPRYPFPDLPLRLPSAEDQAEIAVHLSLTADQSEWLWRQVGEMCRDFMRYREMTPLPGPEQRAFKHELRAFSQQLSALQALLDGTSPHLDLTVGRLVGHVLAERLNELGFYEPLGTRPVDRFGLHDLDKIEGEPGSEPGEFEATRWSVSRFVADMEQKQAHGRRRSSPQEMSLVLRDLLGALSRPIARHIAMAGRDRGGAPPNLYRKEAVARLADWYEELYGERPTSTPEGRFVLFCDQILTAIGLDTRGIETAISRELARHKG